MKHFSRQVGEVTVLEDKQMFDDPGGLGKASGKGSNHACYSKKEKSYPSQSIHFDRWPFTERFKELIEHLHTKKKDYNVSIRKASNYALMYSSNLKFLSFQAQLLISFPAWVTRKLPHINRYFYRHMSNYA